MPRPTDIRIVNVALDTERIDYRSPIKFGGRVVPDVVIANVGIEWQTRDGRHGRGIGSMPIGNVWAWPSSVVTPPQSLSAMQRFAEAAVKQTGEYKDFGHPLDLTRDLAGAHESLGAEVVKELALAETMPKLAQLVAASPIEAGCHIRHGTPLASRS